MGLRLSGISSALSAFRLRTHKMLDGLQTACTNRIEMQLQLCRDEKRRQTFFPLVAAKFSGGCKNGVLYQNPYKKTTPHSCNHRLLVTLITY
jgi:hypothetical protein